MSLICIILKNDTKELIYKTEIDSQTQNHNLMATIGESRVRRGRNKLGI